ncbi:MAG: hypothetical protein ACK42Z_08850 [Candidatus Kapaibacteriota bacterium]
MKKIIIVLWITVLILLFFDYIGSAKEITLKYYCSLYSPDTILGPTCVLTSQQKLWLLPYSLFATTHLYEFEFADCKFKEVHTYPDEAKYCFIPKTDTTTWKWIENSKVICYPCTFSFRQIFLEMHSGNIFAFAYSLSKVEGSENEFLPRRLIFRLDTNEIKPIGLDKEEWALFPLGRTCLKGDSLVSFVTFNKQDTNTKRFFCLYNLKTNEIKPIIDIQEVGIFVGKKLTEMGPAYFIDDSLVVCYLYRQTPPIILNLKNNKYRLFKYQGLLSELKESNLRFWTNNNGDSMRTFLLGFLPNSSRVVVVGGENKGTTFKDFVLQKVYLQFYLKEDLSLEKEFDIKFPLEKKYVFVDCFISPKSPSKIYFLFYTNDNVLDVYYVDI